MVSEFRKNMKVVEASTPSWFFIQQYAHKGNECFLGLSQQDATAIGPWR
jgi:hypothetical protein